MQSSEGGRTSASVMGRAARASMERARVLSEKRRRDGVQVGLAVQGCPRPLGPAEGMGGAPIGRIGKVNMQHLAPIWHRFQIPIPLSGVRVVGSPALPRPG